MKNEKYVLLQIPDSAVFKWLGVWLAAFFPLNAICSMCFLQDRKAQLSEHYKHFQNIWDVSVPVFENYQKNLRDIDCKVIKFPKIIKD